MEAKCIFKPPSAKIANLVFNMVLFISHIILKCIWSQSEETIGNVKTAGATNIAIAPSRYSVSHLRLLTRNNMAQAFFLTQ
jgi:hypothetical protein